jgi:3-hydroxyisobutyrate dehydrogenase-like beta-hydroxyacid dehydrogenase
MQTVNTPDSRSPCGVVGAGSIGAALGRRLAACGHPVTAYDVDAARVAALADAGVRAAATPRALAQESDVVLLALPDTPQILAVLEGDDGLEAGLRQGAALLVTSTVDPSTPRELAERLAPHGVEVLDTPISGGPVAAEAGTLAIMAGASDEAFARLAPLLGQLGVHVVHVGPVGDGEVAKLVNNLMGSVIAIGIAEGLALAATSGVDVDRVIDAVAGGSGSSWILREWIPRTVLADRSQTHFAVDLMCKDMGLVARFAEREGVELEAGRLAGEVFDRLRTAGYGGSDFSILAAVRAEAAGAVLPERGPVA